MATYHDDDPKQLLTHWANAFTSELLAQKLRELAATFSRNPQARAILAEAARRIEERE